MAENSSPTSSADKPVIVRVKRKAFQSALDAFWLEIHERPLKRALLDFGKLSISDASSSKVEELKTKKILVRRVETVTSSKDTFDVLRSFVQTHSSSESKTEEKNEERRQSWKTADKQDRLLVKARQSKEVLSRHTRFEQIWRSRKGKNEAPEDEAVYDKCRLYDVVRVDVEEHVEVHNKTDTDIDDYKMMADFLPLLREVLPTAAEEIEHDVMSKQDGFVYDVYAIEDNVNVCEMDGDSTSFIPLVQVDEDDDFYDGPDDSSYETDDSNAENNPLNDYPDESESEEEDAEEDSDESDNDDNEEEKEEEEEEVMSMSRLSDELSESDGIIQSDELKSTNHVAYERQEFGYEHDDQIFKSYEYEGSEHYDWSEYGDQAFGECGGDDEDSYW